MANGNENKYNGMEMTLQRINTDYISLPKAEVERNNGIVELVLRSLGDKMKHNPLFRGLFRHVYYGGSYYNGLKVGIPDEYDIDLLFTLPECAVPKIINSDVPGFVQVQVTQDTELVRKKPLDAEKYALMAEQLMENGFLVAAKVSAWMHSVVQKAINELGMGYNPEAITISLRQDGPAHTLDISKGRPVHTSDLRKDGPARTSDFRNNGPAHTSDSGRYGPAHTSDLRRGGPAHTSDLRTNGPANTSDLRNDEPAHTLDLGERNKDSPAKFSIDLVPCFVFSQNNWPKPPFRQNPVPNKKEFFIVPKQPHRNGDTTKHWRLSFQEQENVLISDFDNLKPALRLLKKLRHTQNQQIASYYIKTLFLWELETNKDLWNKSLSYVFMTMLKKYKSCIDQRKIMYYWSKANNLVDNLHPDTLTNISNRLALIISEIERNPVAIAKYLLPDHQLMKL